MTTWIVMIAVGAGSYLFRVGPLIALRHVALSERADRTIRHAGLAAIAALIAGTARHTSAHAPLVAVLAALGLGALLAARRASMVRILVAGGALYALLVVVIGWSGR
jgi:branched-subunit amino acid transport protein